MRRQYKKSAFLIKFSDGSYDIAKTQPTIASSSTQLIPVPDGDDAVLRPQTFEHHGDYLNYVDQGDSGSVAICSRIIWWKAVKFLRDDAIIRTFTLDGKPFISFKFE
jgi:hypothetical protein